MDLIPRREEHSAAMVVETTGRGSENSGRVHRTLTQAQGNLRLADKYSEQVRKCISRTKGVNGAGNYRKAHWITQMGISGDCLHPGHRKERG